MFVVLNDPELPEFNVYLETRIGGKSGRELLSELPKSSCFVSKGAVEDIAILKNASEIGEITLVKFARIKVRDLGFKSIPPTISEIWSRIESLGFGLCKIIDVPTLRAKICQPIGDVVFVATEQRACFGGIYHVFTLGQYHDSTCLSRILIHPSHRFGHKLGLDTEIIIRISESL